MTITVKEHRMGLTTGELDALPDRSVVATPAGSIAQLAIYGEPRFWLVPGHEGCFSSDVVATWDVTLLRRGVDVDEAERAAALQTAIEAEIGAWPDGNERASDYAAARGQCKRAIQAVLAAAAVGAVPETSGPVGSVLAHDAPAEDGAGL